MGSKSKAANWYNGQRVRHRQAALARWKRLLAKENLSPEFKHQIERNIAEKS